MFGNKKETKPIKTTFNSGSRNVIDETTKIVGDITSNGDFRIDGNLEGSLITKGRLIVGKKGNIKGTVECLSADIEGNFEGDLKVIKTLNIKSTATVSGDIVVAQILTEAGAVFNANCNMSPKLIANKNEKEKAKTK